MYCDSNETGISSVGIHDDKAMDPWVAIKGPKSDQPTIFQVMDENPAYGPHGYLVHDACWCLLQYNFAMDALAHRRLYEICQSLPTPLCCAKLSWGHDYGGLVVQNDMNFYPWEDRVEVGDAISITEARRVAQINPLETIPLRSSDWATIKFPPHRTFCMSSDCFASLPMEIYEMIATLLPTSDVQNLRYASKTFSALYFSQRFWASRFAQGRERDYVLEARDLHNIIDWRNLYWRTKDCHAPPALRNRIRIWKLISYVRTYLSLSCNSGARKLSHNILCNGLHWTLISGDVKQEPGGNIDVYFEEGCRALKESSHSVPVELCEIACSVVVAGDGTYVTGLRLTDKLQNSIKLGYILDGEELVCKIKVLRGFRVAVGSRGIRALQIIREDHSTSSWFGQNINCPVSQRLANADAIAALKVAFDVSSSGHIVAFFMLTDETSFRDISLLGLQSLRQHRANVLNQRGPSCHCETKQSGILICPKRNYF